jgi:hypothetical protein
MELGVNCGLSRKEIMAAFLSLGLGVGGSAMIAAAILDPEPTSKLALVVGGGIAFVAGGGFSILRLLTKTSPTNFSVGKNGFHVGWSEPAPKQTDIHNYGQPQQQLQRPDLPYYEPAQQRPADRANY